MSARAALHSKMSALVLLGFYPKALKSLKLVTNLFYSEKRPTLADLSYFARPTGGARLTELAFTPNRCTRALLLQAGPSGGGTFVECAELRYGWGHDCSTHRALHSLQTAAVNILSTSVHLKAAVVVLSGTPSLHSCARRVRALSHGPRHAISLANEWVCGVIAL